MQKLNKKIIYIYTHTPKLQNEFLKYLYKYICCFFCSLFNKVIHLCFTKQRTIIVKHYCPHCLSIILLFSLHRPRNISSDTTHSCLFYKLVHVAKLTCKRKRKARISDLSILNLLVLVLWHYTDSKSHNSNTEDKEKKKWNYPVWNFWSV